MKTSLRRLIQTLDQLELSGVLGAQQKKDLEKATKDLIKAIRARDYQKVKKAIDRIAGSVADIAGL